MALERQWNLNYYANIDAIIQRLPPPEPILHPKIWHTEISDDVRNKRISKFVLCHSCATFFFDIDHETTKDLIVYARNVEKDIFEKADSLIQYYELFAEILSSLKFELQNLSKKKNLSLELEVF